MNRDTAIRRSMIEVARRHTRAMQEMNMRTVLLNETFRYCARAEAPTSKVTPARHCARYANGRFVPHLQLAAAVMRFSRLTQLDIDPQASAAEGPPRRLG